MNRRSWPAVLASLGVFFEFNTVRCSQNRKDGYTTGHRLQPENATRNLRFGSFKSLIFSSLRSPIPLMLASREAASGGVSNLKGNLFFSK